MLDRIRVRSLPLLIALLVVGAGLSRPAEAGVSQSVLALAAPLAQQFGVPASAVTSLLESGISLESVTQLLLVSQSAGSELDSTTKLYREQGNDIAKTAEKLGVDPAAYSKQKVASVIDEAKASATADASKAASDEANKALDSALGGFRR
jgi:hypothetical protein